MIRLVPKSLRGMMALLLAAAVLPLVLSELAVVIQWTRWRYQDERDSTIDVARSVAGSFYDYVLSVVRHQQTISHGLHAFRPASAESANKFLADAADHYAALVTFHWVGPDSRIMASSDPASVGRQLDRSYLPRLVARARTQPATGPQADWLLSDLYRLPDGRYRFDVASARAQDGAPGVVVAEIDPAQLGSLVLDLRLLGRRSFAIFDSRGRLVFVSDSPVPVSPQLRDWVPDPMLVRALAGEEAAGRFESPVFSGQPMLVARTPVREAGWVVGAGQLEKDILRPLWLGFHLLLGLLALSAAVSVIGAWMISRRIVGDVARLGDHAAAVGRGDLQPRPVVKGISELEALSRRMNDMADRLAERSGELQNTLDELRRSNAELESFSYSISHDLRAPLRAIDGFSRMLIEDQSDRLDPEGRRRLDVVRANAQRMGRLIDDLLAFSRLGRQTIRPAVLDMEQLVRQVWQELEADRTGRTVDLRIAPLPPAEGDAAMVRQVLTNLLDNALKFTRPRKSAIIEVGALPGDAQTAYFVRDNGVGFDDRYVDKLFGVFQRLHREEEFEGTGVGLARVHRIITRHDGRVWAQAKLGEGATFYFTLPRPG